MRADAHRTAAEEVEKDVATLRANAGSNRTIIELAWGAAFHWIAYGCQRKYQKHLDNHQGLGKYLNGLNEGLIGDYWREFEKVRQGGFYGHQQEMVALIRALDLLANIRMWATS